MDTERLKKRLRKLEKKLSLKCREKKAEVEWLQEQDTFLYEILGDPEAKIATVIGQRDQILTWIREKQLDSSSSAISYWCNEIAHLAPTDEDIRYEVEGLRRLGARTRAKLSETKRELSDASQLLSLLTASDTGRISTLTGDGRWLVKSAHRRCKAQEFVVDCPVNEYVGFKNALNVPKIAEALTQKVTDVGAGVLVSEGVEIQDIPVDVDNILVGVSEEGWLCICSGFTGCILVFYNLHNGNSFSIKCGFRFTCPYFYKGKIYLLPHRGKWIYEAKLRDLIETPTIKTFRRIKIGGCWNWGDNSKTPETGLVRYVTSDYTIRNYNIIERIDEPLMISGGEVLSSTGIDMGENDFIYKVDGCILAHTTYNKSKVISRNTYIGLVCIPSQSSPTNPSKALYISQDSDGSICYTYLGNIVELALPFEYEPFISIIRVYKDVFLVYDKFKRKWKYLRILVP